jgi:uncharacterized protein YaiE (UPF0345 family)
MVSKLKVGGLVLLAVFATSAVIASVAQAGEFTASKYPATITGTQLSSHEFGFNFAGTVVCSKATFDSKLEAAAKSLTVSAEYKECATPEGGEVTVAMKSCDYEFVAGEKLMMERVDGFLNVKCAEAGDEITFEEPANGCVVKVPAQKGRATLVYTNHKEAKDFDVDFSVVDLEYTQSANCPGGAGKYVNGTYTGSSTMKADEEISTSVD